MTFQVALVGSDGLVVASDRMKTHISLVTEDSPDVQDDETDKFFKSDSLVCFYAGTDTARDAALAIAQNCQPKESQQMLEWFTSVRDAAIKGIGLPPVALNDQIFVVRRDFADTLWLVSRGSGAAHAPSPITRYRWTGGNCPARFLPCHLWNENLTISQLKVLAVLTLAYAVEEPSSGIAGPFDVLTLNKAGDFEWFRYAGDDLYRNLQGKLMQSFEELCKVPLT
jgi:hypothetical protein